VRLCVSRSHLPTIQLGPEGKWLFWPSPLADPLAFLRIFMDALNQPTQWRGRKYE